MSDPQNHLEAIYQAMLRWGDLPEFKAVLREVEPAELVTLLRAAKELDLIGEPQRVKRRVDRIVAIVETHEKWERRLDDLRFVGKVFGIVGGTMAAIWVWLREPLMNFLRWWIGGGS